MIYVYGPSVQDADAYARVNGLNGARCYGNSTVSRYGTLYARADTIYILPGVAEPVVDSVRRDLLKRTASDRPELRFVAD